MMVPTLIVAIAAVATLGVAAAQAEPSYATADVNMRAGPDTEFPSVGVIPEGEPIYVEGCLQDESWCDVRWADNRGWVCSEYIGFDYHGQTAFLPDLGIAAFGIPVVTFVAADYWHRWYVGRPWYAEHARWEAFKWHPREGWHAPPPGPRKAGWWRAGYVAPHGMRPPPERGWRRPEHHDHHDVRGDHRRDHHDDRHDDRH